MAGFRIESVVPAFLSLVMVEGHKVQDCGMERPGDLSPPLVDLVKPREATTSKS